jgi:hypothetical protein
MRLWRRVGVFAGGVYSVIFGLSMLSRGVFEYDNYYHAVVYSPAIVMVGGLLILLALIPDRMVARLGKRRKTNDLKVQQRRGCSAS